MRALAEVLYTSLIAYLVVVFLSGNAIPSEHKTESLEEMMLRRIAWITEHFDYEYNGEELPDVVQVPLETLNNLRGSPPDSDTRAVYDHFTNTIYLRVDYEPTALDSAYIVVHELVHFLQNIEQPIAEIPCPRGLERPAYKVQEKWQEEFGPWPLEFNWLFVYVISDCSRDYE